MSVLLDQLNEWLEASEGEAFEFKEAKSGFEFERLGKYAAAFANMGGGKILLGVTDKRPRRVVGSQAFLQPEDTVRTLCQKIPLRISFDLINHPSSGRVLVFNIPSRPVGTPIKFDGRYWTRRNDSLVEMDEEQLRDIYAEGERDYTAEICKEAKIDDLDADAIEDFRRRWMSKSDNAALATLNQTQLLTDAEVITADRITYAALILFGKEKAIGRFLPQAEVTFEYRSSDASGPAQSRIEYRRGFFSYYEDLWKTINSRNDLQHYQEGFFVWDIPTFDERTIREAILNAISHRDYHMAGNVFIRQFTRRIEITSPGGFPFEVTLDNILDRQSPRNRRVADVFLKCGLVERSGQGMNLIFEELIKHGKPIPDFTLTDKHQVGIILHGTVENSNFVRFLEKVGKEQTESFSTTDWLLLGRIANEQKIPEHYKSRVPRLLELGVIERAGRGKLLLSRRYYTFIGKRGAYTRKKGLDREHSKALLLEHIENYQDDGSPLRDLQEVIPSLSRDQLRTLLKELRDDGKVHVRGTTRSALWFPGSEQKDSKENQ